MISSAFSKLAESNKEFRFRGKEPGRLENFSDACFALAITLLLISTSPPTTFEQIKRFTWELIPFAVCITFIVLIWYEHFVFYYRYGIREGTIIVWNSLFLVLVLFYVYPLKFLFTKLTLIPISLIFDVEILKSEAAAIRNTDISSLMIIYGVGASAVFFVIMFMYKSALSRAEELALTEIEIFDTKASIRSNFLMALIPLLSAFFALIFSSSPFLSGVIPGFTYFLYSPVMFINGSRTSKQRKKLLENHLSSEASPVASNAGEPI